MRLRDIYRGSFGLSFELFPPKTAAGAQALQDHVDRLVALSPSYFTCTYGAGGSTREKTLDVICRIKQRYQLPVASHLTCVGSSVDQLRHFLTRARNQGVDNIVALRGDPPKGDTQFQPVPGGLRYANELVTLIRNEFPEFGVAVAGYPETHQEAPSPEADLGNLHRKVRCGAEAVITQLFYNNKDFYAFRDRYEARGIDVPLVPGLLPVTSLAQIQRITSLCAARLPTSFVEELGKHDDPDWQLKVGVDFAIGQVQDLVRHDVPGIHFYVLNKSEATSQVVAAVDLPATTP
jgi:methylenetetrahydrofolate reductase (NADPH)